MRYLCALLMLPCLMALADEKDKPKHEWIGHDKDRAAKVTLQRTAGKTPLLVANSPADGRPYIHPLHAPDGKGVLTEFSPNHHKHQTGLYVGFVKVNGRDYFHNRGKDYFSGPSRVGHGQGRRNGVPYSSWETTYDLLDKNGKALVKEEQYWRIWDRTDHLLIDLELTLTAEQVATLGKHDYGGLFLRMPWKKEKGGKAVNSEGDENAKAEGKKAKWVDVGMPIDGRKDWGRIAILDHKDNPRHPVAWRVDGQLGVGPALTRSEDYKIEKGKSLRLKYRLVVYTGELNKKLIEKVWKEFEPEKDE